MSEINPENRARVLLVDYSTEMWGAEITLLKMAELFENDGFDLTLTGPEGAFADAWVRAGRSFIPLQRTPRGGIRSAVSDGKRQRVSLTRLVREIRNSSTAISQLRKTARNFDVLHSNSLWAHFDVAVAARSTGRGSILDLHDFIGTGIGRYLMSAATLLSGCTVGVSEAVTSVLPPWLKKRVRVVQRGVDLERFDPSSGGSPQPRACIGCGLDAKLVTIVGRIDPEKGVDRVIEAVANLKRSDVHLAVVGTYSASQHWHEHVLKLGDEVLGVRAHFLGRRDDVPLIMRRSNVVVNASDAEPLGGVILEAQASGVPVIAIATGGSPEMIDNDIDGILVPPNDIPALSLAIEKVLSDDQFAKRLGSSARTRVERLSSWQACCNGFEQAYLDAMGSKKKVPTA